MRSMKSTAMVGLNSPHGLPPKSPDKSSPYSSASELAQEHKLVRRGSYQLPRRKLQCNSPARRGGSVRYKKRAEEEILTVPLVNIQVISPEEGNVDQPQGGARRKNVPTLNLEGGTSITPPDYSPAYSPGNSPWKPAAPLPTNMWPSKPPDVLLPSKDQYANRRRSSTMHQFDVRQPTVMHRDQFDEFVYKSQHIASSQPNSLPNPPEVNIEVPSDSDSSRRPSKASFSNQTISSASSFSNFTVENRRASVCATQNSVFSANKKPLGHSNSLLAARPVLDRRSSHTGVLMTRSSGTRPAVSNCTSPRRDSSNMLGVPRRRSRGASLPGSMDLNQEDIYRLRNFSMAGRKVINRGDSLKTRSNHSINSTGSRYIEIYSDWRLTELVMPSFFHSLQLFFLYPRKGLRLAH